MKSTFVNKVNVGLAEFKALADRGNLIPVYKEILADLDTPVSAYRKLDERPSFLLESLEGGEKWARYSFLGLRPSKVVRGKGRTVQVTDARGTITHDVHDPIEFIKTMMSVYRPALTDGEATGGGLPRFYGGMVGYIGYDMVRFMERIPERAAPGLDMPDLFLMLADTLLIFDNLRQTIKVVANVHTEGKRPEEAYGEAVGRIEDIIGKLRQTARSAEADSIMSTTSAESGGEGFVSAFGPREVFEQAVDKCKEYIKSGDVFQLVLSQRFGRKSSASPFNIYRALRVINPSPYMYFLDTGEAAVVGSSPEILVRLEGGKITLRPIAGTRRRGRDEVEDASLRQEMKSDPKERAEHIMLVDLGRNDVGRVAEIGSVKVTDLMSVEMYSHVMHMVSNVEGTLQRGLDCYDVLRACFPAGTVSGSPKIRAMEVIEELEPHRRGPYAGSVGYFGYSGNMDTCITIRTILALRGEVYVQAGAGIVADSVPELEYSETVNKATGMMKAVEMAEGGML